MSYYGVERFDHQPSEQELASELRSPPPRPARREKEWARHFDARLGLSERRTMKAVTTAVAVVLKEERDEHRKTVLDLRCTIAALEQRLAVLEERKMVVFDKGVAGSPFRVIEAA